MAMAYHAQQMLFPWCHNLGATVAAGTADVWMLGTLPADIPTAQLAAAYLTSGASVSVAAAGTTVGVQKNASTVMASLSTVTGGTALTADTPAAMALSATIANRKATAADTIKIDKAETSTGAAITAQAALLMWWRVGSEDLTI